MTRMILPFVFSSGVPVINVNVMTAGKEVVTRIRSDDEEIGRMQAEQMSKRLNGKGNVLILAGPAGTSWAVGRSKGFEEFMKAKFPNIKILEKRWLDSDPAAGMKEMEDALQAYPNIDGVMTGSDMLGLGVGQAIFRRRQGREDLPHHQRLPTRLHQGHQGGQDQRHGRPVLRHDGAVGDDRRGCGPGRKSRSDDDPVLDAPAHRG